MNLKQAIVLNAGKYKVADTHYGDVVSETNDVEEAKKRARSRPFSKVVQKKPVLPEAYKSIRRKKDTKNLLSEI